MSWHWNDDSDELKARIALLQHYSSKTSNQGIILLTLALVLFGYVQARSSLSSVEFLTFPLEKITSFFVIWIIPFLAIRALSRLFYWGKLLRYTLYAPLTSKEELSKELAREDQKLRDALQSGPGSEMMELMPTYLKRLEKSCVIYAEAHIKTENERWNLFFRYFAGKPLIVFFLLWGVFLLHSGLFSPWGF